MEKKEIPESVMMGAVKFWWNRNWSWKQSWINYRFLFNCNYNYTLDFFNYNYFGLKVWNYNYNYFYPLA